MLAYGAFAQTADALLGKWQSAHQSGQIQFYKTGEKYFAKLIWVKNVSANGKEKVDMHNPNPDLQSQPIIGLEVLKNFTYQGDGKWENGTVYDPKSGNTYKCKLSMQSSDKLDIRGYMGMSLIGKTETWTRIQ